MPQLTWLITGCSSGFGEALVLALVQRGDRVVATAREVDTIKHLEGPNVQISSLDVTAPQEQLNDIVKASVTAFGGIDVLVNNAGYIQGGPMEIKMSEKFLEVYNVNVVGAVNVTRAIMPHFREKKGGMVVFMGSQSGWSGDIGASAYCATKFALEGVFESFQKEAALFGIKSIIFEPGYFRTKIFDPTHLRVEIEPHEAYAEVLKQMGVQATTIDGNQPGDPKKAVERIIDVVRQEGVAEGREMPKRLPLGADSLTVIREKCEETLKICKDWEDVINSTDF